MTVVVEAFFFTLLIALLVSLVPLVFLCPSVGLVIFPLPAPLPPSSFSLPRFRWQRPRPSFLFSTILLLRLFFYSPSEVPPLVRRKTMLLVTSKWLGRGGHMGVT